MIITRLKLKNWRNFKNLDIPLNSRTYIIGANATGKSNLLDVFRFLRDICKPAGGGLQRAIEIRGGIKKLRCLQAKIDTEVLIEVELSEEMDSPPAWTYTLGFKSEGSNPQRVYITKEIVLEGNENRLNRPNENDKEDKIQRTQTYLEQINANKAFRSIADFFIETTYLHLIPQLLKHGELKSQNIDDDPFGQELLYRIAKARSNTRDARIKRIQSALEKAVPQFSELKFEKDKITGLPHLAASYKHWRNHGAWQREDQFSDGTLRLIGLLWMIQESNSLLLLEEPELSLNDAIVTHIPLMIDRVLRERKSFNRQVIITTHSEALLRNPLDSRSIILLQAKHDGTEARPANEEERILLELGRSPAEVMLPKARPTQIDQIGLF